MAALKETIIPAKEGVQILMHVFAPGMKYRVRFPESYLPTVCLRWSDMGFKGMKMYEKAEILGPSTLELINAPLSGSSGRAQVVLLTHSPVKVWSYVDDPVLIDTVQSDSVDDVLREVIARHSMLEQHRNRRLLDKRNKIINRETHKKVERPKKVNRF